MIDDGSGTQESIFRFCKSLKAELLPPKPARPQIPTDAPRSSPGCDSKKHGPLAP